MRTLAYMGYALLGILTVDFFVFMAWAMSGQYPVDGFYIGAITTNILRAIFF